MTRSLCPIAALFLFALATLLPGPAAAQFVGEVCPPELHELQAPEPASDEIIEAHGIAMHGDLKYGPEFEHFDYVNPDAPKGGTIRLAAEGTFDSFHPYVTRGTAAAGSTGPVESLMTTSADEAFSEYGLLAETLRYPEDRSWIEFDIRPEARWHDGEPVKPEDVIFSANALREQGAPFYRFYYRDIAFVEKVGTRTVRFEFDGDVNRELPLIVGQMPIFPEHYWRDRDFASSTLEPPLGSGPYRITDFEAGRRVVYERVEDYWGADLPVKRGTDNFDRIIYEYFRDPVVIREAIKSGDIDVRMENQAKAWAVDYDIGAVRRGLLIQEEIPHERTQGLQAFVMNTRRAPFDDVVFRRAMALAFDYEWTNRNLFFGQYERSPSYFTNSEMAAVIPPTEDELAILEPLADQIPPEVLTEVYEPPRTDGSGWPRENLLKALALLEEAGYEVRDFRLIDPDGVPVSIQFLLRSQAFERIVLPYRHNLERLGIDVHVRLVDASQYVNRVRNFEFDVIVGGWGQSDSPGNEQRDYWSSPAADRPGSRNHAGIRNPAVDCLVELVIAAPDRESLVTRTRALDRALQWGHYVVPNWHTSVDRYLYWDKFGRPGVTPDRGTDMSYWWWDEDRARALDEAMGRRRTSALPGAADGSPRS